MLSGTDLELVASTSRSTPGLLAEEKIGWQGKSLPKVGGEHLHHRLLAGENIGSQGKSLPGVASEI